MKLFDELKRRNVFRVGLAYVLMGWMLLQGADFVFDLIGAPNWVIQSISVVMLIGLPVALFFAWAYEMTPEGIKREAEVDRSQSITPTTGRKLNTAIIAILAVIIVSMGVERMYVSEAPDNEDAGAGTVDTVEKSIAVLPFVNMSSDPEQEYFSDGISEEILNSLVKLKDLKVAGRTSSFAFKGKNDDLRSIGNALGVNHILEGSVRKSGAQVRITAQLIQAGDGFHLWSETYTRELNDIFAVQDEISQAIVNALKLTLSGTEKEYLTRRSTDNIAAYNKYLQGRALWHQRGLSGLSATIEFLREAVALDPGFSDGWAALADALILMPEYGAPEVHEFVAMARDANFRTMEIEPDSAHALTTRAYIKFMHDYDYDGARADFLRAIELEPAYPTLQQWYGEFLASQGDVDGALAQFRKAADLDPLAPIMWHVSGYVSGMTGRFEQSLDYYRRVLKIAPKFESSHANLARVYAEMGEYVLARRYESRHLGLIGQERAVKYTFIDAMENPLLKAEVLENMASRPDIYPDGAVYNAYDYMLLGEPNLALESLQKGLEAGDPYATFAGWAHVYDEMRDDPRFQAHLAKINMWP